MTWLLKVYCVLYTSSALYHWGDWTLPKSHPPWFLTGKNPVYIQLSLFVHSTYKTWIFFLIFELKICLISIYRILAILYIPFLGFLVKRCWQHCVTYLPASQWLLHQLFLLDHTPSLEVQHGNGTLTQRGIGTYLACPMQHSPSVPWQVWTFDSTEDQLCGMHPSSRREKRPNPQ